MPRKTLIAFVFYGKKTDDYQDYRFPLPKNCEHANVRVCAVAQMLMCTCMRALIFAAPATS